MPCPAPSAGRARINIQVVGTKLTYTVAGLASEPTPGKHRVPKNTPVEWCCDAGPIAIHFYKGNTNQLFTSGDAIIQSAAAGTPTAVETTKNNATKKQFKYSVSVAAAAGLIFDDPDFETGGGGGEGDPYPKNKKAAAHSKRSKKQKR